MLQDYEKWCQRAVEHLSMMQTCDMICTEAQINHNWPLAIDYARTMGEHLGLYRIAVKNAERAL